MNTKKEMHMTYKIEGRGRTGDWSEEYVGSDREANTFATYLDAAVELPALARVLGCGVSDLRIVEREREPEPLVVECHMAECDGIRRPKYVVVRYHQTGVQMDPHQCAHYWTREGAQEAAYGFDTLGDE